MKGFIRSVVGIITIAIAARHFFSDSFDLEEAMPFILIFGAFFLFVGLVESNSKKEKKAKATVPKVGNLKNLETRNFDIPNLSLEDNYPHEESIYDYIFDCDKLYFNIIKNGKLLFHYNKQEQYTEITEFASLKNLLPKKAKSKTNSDFNSKRIPKRGIKEPYHGKQMKELEKEFKQVNSTRIDCKDIAKIIYRFDSKKSIWAYSFSFIRSSDNNEEILITLPIYNKEEYSSEEFYKKRKESIKNNGIRILELISYEMQKKYTIPFA